jgi:hypothetical protein
MPQARSRKGRFDTGMATANDDYIISIVTTLSHTSRAE